MTATQYILPPEYHVFERDEKFLMIDPRNFIWFVTDEAGKTAFDGLTRNGSPQDAAEELAKELGISSSDSVVTDYVDEFVNHLVEIKFLHETQYVEVKWAPSLLERPKLLYLHLTSKCNLRCPYCYNQEHRFQLIQLNRKKEEPSFEGSAEDFFRVIDDAARLGFNSVKITGGEALLNKDALAIAARAKAHGMFVNLLTNATIITEASAEQIAEAVSVVSISLDSANPEEHDAVRGRGTHAKVLKSIGMLRDAGMSRIHLNSVVTPVNMNSIEEFLDFAHNDIKAGEVTLAGSTMAVDDDADRWGAKDYILSGDQFLHVHEQQRHFYQIQKQKTGKRTVTTRGSLRRTQCGVGNGLVSVESNGDIYPCQTMHQPEFLCGNAFREGLEHVLETSGILKTMKSLQVDILPECNECPMRYVCSGGCRKEAYAEEGDLLARNRKMCPIYFEEALDQLWDAASIPVQELPEVTDNYVAHQSCH